VTEEMSLSFLYFVEMFSLFSSQLRPSSFLFRVFAFLLYDDRHPSLSLGRILPSSERIRQPPLQIFTKESDKFLTFIRGSLSNVETVFFPPSRGGSPVIPPPPKFGRQGGVPFPFFPFSPPFLLWNRSVKKRLPPFMLISPCCGERYFQIPVLNTTFLLFFFLPSLFHQ